MTEDRRARERDKAIEMAVGQIEKQFGKGAIMRLGQGAIAAIPRISTGSISIDNALGIGGVPRGRVVEIFGPEASGKTTLALQVIAQAQRSGGTAAFVDAEHALDPTYASKLGVDLDNLLVSQPDNGEQALEIVEVLVRSGGADVVVVDSVAALVPRAEIDGEMGDAQVGLQARDDGRTDIPAEVYELFPVLEQMQQRPGGNLSGGQQQQLAIARALVGDPDVLLLDEPTEGIQPSIILEIEKVLVQLKAKGKFTIVLVEQYFDFARQIADSFFLMDRGSILLQGQAGELSDESIKQHLTF